MMYAYTKIMCSFLLLLFFFRRIFEQIARTRICERISVHSIQADTSNYMKIITQIQSYKSIHKIRVYCVSTYTIHVNSKFVFLFFVFFSLVNLLSLVNGNNSSEGEKLRCFSSVLSAKKIKYSSLSSLHTDAYCLEKKGEQQDNISYSSYIIKTTEL